MTGSTPSQAQVRLFVFQNFEEGRELVDYLLPDFNPTPSFVNEITNETVKNFTLDLLKIWPELARKVSDKVIQNQEQYSLIPVPNGFIIPGGRFREYYYWDSYWIIDGLLISGMNETAQGMIENFMSLVERFGFVPNGGRIYYLKRSQPPLLTPMTYIYFQQTRNITWLKSHIKTLAKELNYWVNQTVKVTKNKKVYTLAHYDAESAGPRPESYREDLLTASYFTDPQKQDQVYIDLKSGAESGWDFSTRWVFDENGGNSANLSHIQTRRVIPVDLNAFLCGAYKDISQLYYALGQVTESFLWQQKHLKIRTAIDAVLWDEKDGIWYDYDIKLNKHRRLFYPSSVTPLWSKCFEQNKGQELGKRVLNYLQDKHALGYLGGIPTSNDFTREQWDFPNAWPPLQDIVVRGLDNLRYKPAQEEAKVLARRWVNANMIGYQESGEMFEKYDAVVPGQYGEGGEYEVQAGFGWSNGVALRFIYNYYRKI
ncbi:hypothetical protein ILUMI_07644 [Ignelater luminosus]|uniref:Trehalase n=1 Tax=Ignelater luminosus TaxID=2038154 RepID=A0A8K0D620_IGNLU|nr:hypothetical protein ILUMI_07644 [Ignelater luminosus]